MTDITEKKTSAGRKSRTWIEDPSSGSQLGSRIKIVADSLGRRKNAAHVAGVGEDMIRKYMRGQADPPLSVTTRLARASGYSLQWIILGEGPMKTAPQVTEEHTAYTPAASHSVDLERLEEAISVVERYLQERDVARPPEVKAQLIAWFYHISCRKELIKKNDLADLLDLIYKEHGSG